MIGIFDSGSGGLSVLREVVKLLPGERYVYFSDNAHCPYGEKSPEYIQDRAREITRLLMAKGCNLIVVACNTATGAAIKQLREEFPIPFIGMEPAVKPAALGTKSGVIGVLATAGTLRASKYLDTKGRFQDDVKIVEHVGEGFVELVENGILDGPEAEAVVERSLRPLLVHPLSFPDGTHPPYCGSGSADYRSGARRCPAGGKRAGTGGNSVSKRCRSACAPRHRTAFFRRSGLATSDLRPYFVGISALRNRAAAPDSVLCCLRRAPFQRGCGFLLCCRSQ